MVYRPPNQVKYFPINGNIVRVEEYTETEEHEKDEKVVKAKNMKNIYQYIELYLMVMI